MPMRKTDGSSSQRQGEDGLTLVELLMAMALAAILMTLGGFTLRHYWLVQALDGSQDEAVAQMRQRQEQAVSESHPLVFGVRFRTGSSQWGLVEHEPDDPSTPLVNEQKCTEVETLTFSTRVEVQSASFASSPESTFCAGNLKYASGSAVPGRDVSAYVMFYPRGTATSGTLTLLQPSLNRTRSVQVSPITGRVEST